MTTSGIFRPRQFNPPASDLSPLENGDSYAKPLTLASSHSTIQNVASGSPMGATELTKNNKYCVSRLPAVPPVLEGCTGEFSSELLNAYADNATRCALAVGPSALNVWAYASTDSSPLTHEFPLEKGPLDVPQAAPLALLTRPAPGSALDPGLVIIDASSGDVCFYESIQHAPALGMMRGSRTAAAVPLLVAQGEHITLAENVEPAGIAVATSWNRVMLVRLRDHTGVPRVAAVELAAAASRWTGWLPGSLAPRSLSAEVVAIRAGAVSRHGTAQEIVVTDAAGTFQRFVCLSAGAAARAVDHAQTVLYLLAAHLERNADGLIPGTVLDSRFYDLWPLVQDAGARDVYVCLAAVRSSIHNVLAERLLLLKLKINSSGVLVLSSHQLPSVPPPAELAPQPRLYIPSPGNTAFVAIGNSVVLSDLTPVPTRQSTSASFHYYEPKWEDVVSFKSAVQIIGFGYEDMISSGDNPAVVFITAEHGVVRIERFSNDTVGTSAAEFDPADPVLLLKSRVNQAIFYSEHSFVDFNIDSPVSPECIEPAVRAVISEIMDSSSPYLPANFSSTRDSFDLRLRLLKSLLEYSKVNFTDALYTVLPVIVEALEKMEVASNLWNIIDSSSADATKIKHLFKQSIKHSGLVQKSQDTIRAFLNNNVGDILPVFSELVKDIQASDVLLQLLVHILVSTLHDAVHKNEVAYIFGNSEIPPLKLWLFDSSLLVQAEQVFTQAYCLKNEAFKFLDSSSSRNELLQFAETLYFLVTSAINYMQQTDDDQLHDYLAWYEKRRAAWVDALISRGLSKEVMAISQKYHDFYSVAHILEKEREQMSPEYVFDKIDFFMNQYGYSFASKLFDFYIMHEQFQKILVDCKPYGTFLEKYFQEFPIKSNKVSWIYYSKVQNFKEASKILMSLSSGEKTENQEAREFHYSMAKITAVAAKAKGENTEDVSGLDEITIESESNLVAIRVQNKLHQRLLSYVDNKKELMTLEYFTTNFVNPKLNKNDVITEIGDFFPKFIEQKNLAKENLISLLNSIDPASEFSHVFADSLKVSAHISNDSIFHEQASKTWKTLLCATDDWEVITATEGISDEVNKARVKDTVLYKTFKGIQGNKEIMKVLDGVLEKTHNDHMTDDNTWDAKLQQLVSKCNIEMWISTVRNEAN